MADVFITASVFTQTSPRICFVEKNRYILFSAHIQLKGKLFLYAETQFVWHFEKLTCWKCLHKWMRNFQGREFLYCAKKEYAKTFSRTGRRGALEKRKYFAAERNFNSQFLRPAMSIQGGGRGYLLEANRTRTVFVPSRKRETLRPTKFLASTSSRMVHEETWWPYRQWALGPAWETGKDWGYGRTPSVQKTSRTFVSLTRSLHEKGLPTGSSFRLKSHDCWHFRYKS